jgi:hypothetical protein
MSQPTSESIQETTTSRDPADAVLLDLESALAGQNAELAAALEWPREQGGEVPLDGELIEQLAELDRLVSDARVTSVPSVPEHSTRC